MEGLTNGFIQWMRPLNRLEDFELDKREPNQSKEARFIIFFEMHGIMPGRQEAIMRGNSTPYLWGKLMTRITL